MVKVIVIAALLLVIYSPVHSFDNSVYLLEEIVAIEFVWIDTLCRYVTFIRKIGHVNLSRVKDGFYVEVVIIW